MTDALCQRSELLTHRANAACRATKSGQGGVRVWVVFLGSLGSTRAPGEGSAHPQQHAHGSLHQLQWVGWGWGWGCRLRYVPMPCEVRIIKFTMRLRSATRASNGFRTRNTTCKCALEHGVGPDGELAGGVGVSLTPAGTIGANPTTKPSGSPLGISEGLCHRSPSRSGPTPAARRNSSRLHPACPGSTQAHCFGRASRCTGLAPGSQKPEQGSPTRTHTSPTDPDPTPHTPHQKANNGTSNATPQTHTRTHTPGTHTSPHCQRLQHHKNCGIRGKTVPGHEGVVPVAFSSSRRSQVLPDPMYACSNTRGATAATAVLRNLRLKGHLMDTLRTWASPFHTIVRTSQAQPVNKMPGHHTLIAPTQANDTPLPHWTSILWLALRRSRVRHPHKVAPFPQPTSQPVRLQVGWRGPGAR